MFFSLLIVLTIPCLVLYVLYTQNIAKTVTEEFNDILRNEQAAAMRLTDAELLSFREAMYYFQRSEGLQSYLGKQKFVTNADGKISSLIIGSDINDIYCLNNRIADLFVLFAQSDTVISTGGIYRSANFLSEYYASAGMDFDTLSSLRDETTFHLPASVSRRFSGDSLALVYPLSEYAGVTAVMIVPTERFAEYFTIHKEDLSISALVFDGNGRFLFAGKETPRNLLDMFENAHETIPENGSDSVFEWRGVDYLAIQTVSESTGWRAVLLVPQNQSIYSTLFSVNRFFFLFLAATVLIGGMVILGLFQINYNPVRKLRRKIMTVVPSVPVEAERTDEFDVISDAFSRLQDVNSQLNTTISANIRAIRVTRLQRLLNDSYSSVEEFNTDCEQIGLAFENPCFFVSVFLLPRNLQEGDQVAQQVQKELNKSFESEYVFSLKRDQLVFVHGVRRVDGICSMEPFYASLGLLHDQYGIASTVGIGHAHEGTLSLGKSLVQAISALDYRFIKGNGNVIPFDEVDQKMNDGFAYPRDALRRLQSAISADHLDVSRSIMRDLLQDITHQNMPTFIVRCICVDIVKSILTAPDSMTVDAYSLSSLLLKLSEAETVSDLFELINGVQDSIRPAPKANKMADDKLLQQILDYVEANYCRCDFSIQEIANHFSMLPSSLSGFFKQHTQQSMLEHLIDLRMNQAKRLLLSTDLPLKDIAVNVGYYNVSSFIRRFKEHEGITPNNYRFSNKIV